MGGGTHRIKPVGRLWRATRGIVPLEIVTEKAAGDGFLEYRSVHVPVRICRPLRIATYVTVHVLCRWARFGRLWPRRGDTWSLSSLAASHLHAAAGTVLCTVRLSNNFHHSGAMVKKTDDSGIW